MFIFKDCLFRLFEDTSDAVIDEDENTNQSNVKYVKTIRKCISKKTTKKTKYYRKKMRKNMSSSRTNSLKVINCNAANVKNKITSLEKVINDLDPGIFSLQETFMKTPGQIKTISMKSYDIFEKVREKKTGGGLAIGIKSVLNPVWVREGENEVETLTVQISIDNFNIRITNGYGPQNYADIDVKN